MGSPGGASPHSPYPRDYITVGAAAAPSDHFYKHTRTTIDYENVLKLHDAKRFSLLKWNPFIFPSSLESKGKAPRTCPGPRHQSEPRLRPSRETSATRAAGAEGAAAAPGPGEAGLQLSSSSRPPGAGCQTTAAASPQLCLARTFPAP